LDQGGRIISGFGDAEVQAVGGDHFLDGQYPCQVYPLDAPRDVGEAGAYLRAGGNPVKKRPGSLDDRGAGRGWPAWLDSGVSAGDRLADRRQLVLGRRVPAE